MDLRFAVCMWPALCGRYCPQFDALFEKLTVREHLQLYSRIKGLSEQQVGGLSPWVRSNLRPRGGCALQARDSSSLLLALSRLLAYFRLPCPCLVWRYRLHVW